MSASQIAQAQGTRRIDDKTGEGPVRRHAVVLLGGLLVLIVAGAAIGVRYVRRLKAAAQRPE